VMARGAAGLRRSCHQNHNVTISLCRCDYSASKASEEGADFRETFAIDRSAPVRGRLFRCGSRSFGDRPRLPVAWKPEVYQALWRPLGKETHARNIDGVRFRWRSQFRLLSKCRSRSGRRRSYEAGCSRRVDAARGAILRPPDSARRHQVLPGIRCGASGLPPFLSLVVVKPS
jgi:hypothetical protein